MSRLLKTHLDAGEQCAVFPGWTRTWSLAGSMSPALGNIGALQDLTLYEILCAEFWFWKSLARNSRYISRPRGGISPRIQQFRRMLKWCDTWPVDSPLNLFLERSRWPIVVIFPSSGGMVPARRRGNEGLSGRSKKLLRRAASKNGPATALARVGSRSTTYSYFFHRTT